MSLARSGESKIIEYKESFSLDIRKGSKEKYIELSALKTIVAFLNTNGGTLLVYPFRGWDEREIALSLPSP
jgi:predicted HTH transcriptional regulator